MAVKTKKAIVSRKVSDEQLQNHLRWCAFIEASGKPYEQLTPTWLDFFDSQSSPLTASTELVELIDVAMAQDEKK